MVKIIHLYATTQKDYSNAEQAIKHTRGLSAEELTRLKDPKKKKTEVTSYQKVTKGNLMEGNLKKIWNNTPAPEKPKLKAIMINHLIAKGLWNKDGLQSKKNGERSKGQSQEVKQKDISEEGD